MCGRFTMFHSTEEVVARFDAQPVLFKFMPRYNIGPGQPVAVVREQSRPFGRTLEAFQWGLVPHWARDPEIGARMINARVETLTEKPSYRTSVSRKRCLIPADGFYEWKAGGPAKQPYYVRRRDGGLFGLAALWDEWHSPDGSVLQSCTIITMAPNSLMEAIHSRMPAIIRREDEAEWLDRAVVSPLQAMSLLRPWDPSTMEAYPVTRAVNVPGNEGPDCIAPLAS